MSAELNSLMFKTCSDLVQECFRVNLVILQLPLFKGFEATKQKVDELVSGLSSKQYPDYFKF